MGQGGAATHWFFVRQISKLVDDSFFLLLNPLFITVEITE